MRFAQLYLNILADVASQLFLGNDKVGLIILTLLGLKYLPGWVKLVWLFHMCTEVIYYLIVFNCIVRMERIIISITYRNLKQNKQEKYLSRKLFILSVFTSSISIYRLFSRLITFEI